MSDILTSDFKVVTNLNPQPTYSDKEYTQIEEEMMEWRKGYWSWRNNFFNLLRVAAALVVLIICMIFIMIGSLI